MWNKLIVNSFMSIVQQGEQTISVSSQAISCVIIYTLKANKNYCIQWGNVHERHKKMQTKPLVLLWL